MAMLIILLGAGCMGGGTISNDDDATANDDDATADDDDATANDDDATANDDDATANDDDATSDDDDATANDDDATSDDDDSGDDDDSVAIYDCLQAPTVSSGESIIPGARGYHGLDFDEFGDIVGSDGASLIKSTYSGGWSVFMPGTGSLEQIVYLPNGDLATASSFGVNRITPAGGTSVIVPALSLYGLIVGPDDKLWGAGYPGIFKIDQDTGAANFLFGLSSDQPHSLGFSPDGSTLYIGTIGSSTVYSVGIDANFNPIGTPAPFATNVGGGWHDAVAVDACGFLYVPDFWEDRLFRITPSGTVSVFADWSSIAGGYGHGGVFGNGIGGWSDMDLYVPLPYNGNLVKEVEVGVPGPDWPGVVINAP